MVGSFKSTMTFLTLDERVVIEATHSLATMTTIDITTVFLVRYVVLMQTDMLRKLLVTQVTTEGFLASVSAHVVIQVCLVLGHIGTLRTWKHVLGEGAEMRGCVGLHHSQRVCSEITFVACEG